MNQKLLEQLALAKQAGKQAMAKDFFARPENAAEETPEAGMPEGGEEAAEMPPGGESTMPPEGAPDGEELSEEDLQMLLSRLQGNQR